MNNKSLFDGGSGLQIQNLKYNYITLLTCVAISTTASTSLKKKEPVTKECLISADDSTHFQKFLLDIKESLPKAVIFLPGKAKWISIIKK